MEEAGQVSREGEILGSTGCAESCRLRAPAVCSAGIAASSPHTDRDLGGVFINRLQMKKLTLGRLGNLLT